MSVLGVDQKRGSTFRAFEKLRHCLRHDTANATERKHSEA